MITAMQILAGVALVSAIVSAAGKCPLYVPVLLLSLFACFVVFSK